MRLPPVGCVQHTAAQCEADRQLSEHHVTTTRTGPAWDKKCLLTQIYLGNRLFLLFFLKFYSFLEIKTFIAVLFLFQNIMLISVCFILTTEKWWIWALNTPVLLPSWRWPCALQMGQNLQNIYTLFWLLHCYTNNFESVGFLLVQSLQCCRIQLHLNYQIKINHSL